MYYLMNIKSLERGTSSCNIRMRIASIKNGTAKDTMKLAKKSPIVGVTVT